MLRRIGSLLLVGSLVIACSASGAGPSSAPSTSIAPAGSGAAVIPSSPPPNVTDQPASSPPAEAWDLLWISDSTGSGGAPWQYADHIRQDVGVEVRVTDAWTAGLSAFNLLDHLRGRNDGVLLSYAGEVDLAQAIRDAEVIMVSGNPGGSLAEGVYDCATAYEPEPSCIPNPDACSPEIWAQYESDIQGIFDEIFRIRDGKPVILRTHDWYLPWGPYATWEVCDCVDICVECSRQQSAAIHRAADSRGVPVAEYLTAFSGPEGDQVLPKTSTPDGVHPTVEFSAELASLMAGLGYDPVAPTSD